MSSSDGSKLPQMDLSPMGGRAINPLSELMRAIILRVVDDYNSPGELKEDAIKYMEDMDEEYIFSFRSICKHIGLDPVCTRHAIMFPKKKISTRRRAA